LELVSQTRAQECRNEPEEPGRRVVEGEASSPEMTFTLVFRKSRKRRCCGECLELPGCVSEGDTLEEAEANIRDAVRAVSASSSRIVCAMRPITAPFPLRMLNLLAADHHREGKSRLGFASSVIHGLSELPLASGKDPRKIREVWLDLRRDGNHIVMTIRITKTRSHSNIKNEESHAPYNS